MGDVTQLHAKKYPVAEIFGPTIQGEGVDQGLPCYFVRFGGCDFKCTWCDTPHAVLAENVRHLPRMDDDEILHALSVLPKGPRYVVLSGGNPALHELGPLVKRLRRDASMRVSVETQGTRFKPWLRDVNRLCISPKPPSSEMAWHPDRFQNFLSNVLEKREYDDAWTGNVFVKVVIFDRTDYDWAKLLWHQILEWTGGVGLPFYLSAGNDSGPTVGNPSRRDDRTTEQVRNDLLSKYIWLVNRVMVDKEWEDVKVQAQMHVLAWGNQLGV